MRENMVIAAFGERDQADVAITVLEESGYDADDISIIAKEDGRIRETDAEGTKAGEGAVTGAALGGLAGLLAGAGVIPALAGLLVGGPILAALGLTGAAAAAATGAIAGGLIGALVGAGIPEESAKEYDAIIQRGGIIIAVPVDDEGEADEVKDVFAEHNADQIDSVKAK